MSAPVNLIVSLRTDNDESGDGGESGSLDHRRALWTES